MEGYSVTEAASVLGVPTERVWELLARGVLSGAPEGETGMRVYLQPRPAPAPPEARPLNGNGRRDEPELSPFRELLTEFRGLTERYGQALLALGEARGEVATLRSRVDLLEARMDLRLPTTASSPAASWASTPMPFPAERAVIPTGPAPHEPPPADEHDTEEEEPRSRSRGPRRATESFAEALARAEDPSIPELPGATETAAAMATPREETDAALPRDLPSADAMPVADESDTSAAAASVEVQEVMAEESDAASDPLAPAGGLETVAEESDAPAEVVPDAIAEDAPEEPADAAALLAPDQVTETVADVPDAGPMAPEPAVETAPEETAAAAQIAPDERTDEVPGETADAAAEVVPDEIAEETPGERTAAGSEQIEAVETDMAGTEAVGQEEADAPSEEGADFDVEESSDETQELAEQPRAERLVETEPETAEESAPDPVAAEPLEWDSDRYTTAIEEPDWFAAEAIETQAVVPSLPSAEMEPEVDLPPDQVAEPAPAVEDAEPQLADQVLEQPAEASGAVEPQAAARSEEPGEESKVAAPSEVPDEETMLWFGRSAEDSGGASEMEVATTGTRSPVEPGPDARSFPGSSELDDALAALGVHASREDQPAESIRADTFEPEPSSVQDAGADEWPPRSPFIDSSRATPQSTGGASATPSSASRAYRRLRRIFPG